jgi:hypothetical protein
MVVQRNKKRHVYHCLLREPRACSLPILRMRKCRYCKCERHRRSSGRPTWLGPRCTSTCHAPAGFRWVSGDIHFSLWLRARRAPATAPLDVDEDAAVAVKCIAAPRSDAYAVAAKRTTDQTRCQVAKSSPRLMGGRSRMARLAGSDECIDAPQQVRRPNGEFRALRLKYLSRRCKGLPTRPARVQCATASELLPAAVRDEHGDRVGRNWRRRQGDGERSIGRDVTSDGGRRRQERESEDALHAARRCSAHAARDSAPSRACRPMRERRARVRALFAHTGRGELLGDVLQPTVGVRSNSRSGN